jgi:polysaccharide deacetylase 2 family uncharacterized protein YibQ
VPGFHPAASTRRSFSVTAWLRCLPFVFLLAGPACHRKAAVPDARRITEEMVASARKAAVRGVQVTLSSEPLPTIPEEHAPNSVDVITIRLPDIRPRTTVEQALDDVARRYGMVRTPEFTTEGMVRWTYERGGIATQVIRIELPVATNPLPRAVVISPTTEKTPQLAIIIDDLGYDRSADDAVLSLPHPLTVSVIPHLPLSRETAEQAHQRGYQVLLHMPMQPDSTTVQQEAIELRPGMNGSEVQQALSGMLETVPFAAGVNNHEGSRATSDRQLMGELMPMLRERKLFFIDSRTSAQTVAYQMAEQDDVLASYRKVFLDDTPTRKAVLMQLSQAEKDARHDGWAIAIGHPHPETVGALRDALPQIRSKGLTLVFASDLAH